MESGMRAEAAKYGYSLIVVDANRDNARQQSQVEDFISKRVDAMVLTPYDSAAIGSAIAEANSANIPVFTADIASQSNQGHVVAHIASDNVQGGFEAGKLICAAVGKSGTVAIVDEPEVSSVQQRVDRFQESDRAALPGRYRSSPMLIRVERATRRTATPATFCKPIAISKASLESTTILRSARSPRFAPPD